MEDEIEVPPYFLCPISLEIMKDPVALSTGITFDRHSIEKWLFSAKNTTCPVTKQLLPDTIDLTPNHTLRRLIQAWCTLHATHGIERFPTPKPPATISQILKLLDDAKSPHLQLTSLRKLRLLASESDANKRSLEAAGVVDFLASLLKNNTTTHLDIASDAVTILHNLHVSDSALKNILLKDDVVDSLIVLLQRGSYESRAYAALLLQSMYEVAEPAQIMGLRKEFFVEIVQLLRDHISQKASKAALRLLMELCPWGRNRIKAADAGAVVVLIELLLHSALEKRVCEMALVALDQLCGCAEGRAELLRHGAGLAVVSKKILRVSHAGTERAVRVLSSVSKHSTNRSVLAEMLQVGVVAKLCLVLQVDCGNKTKDRAREILKLHARAWKSSPCFPDNLLSSYPS
ncbi:E3 ubiquitin-protein ligase PUB23-like [Malania oleifera]|uniref:E3 ubiquitin-protein ligase PUB23-like n=1 Tax=Malania oleifera TaxID=397392 RepID=UPI0025ADF6A1|nr:E3 ubiquitin-protein ligase PUB23-like [Malania oleifera]